MTTALAFLPVAVLAWGALMVALLTRDDGPVPPPEIPAEYTWRLR